MFHNVLSTFQHNINSMRHSHCTLTWLLIIRITSDQNSRSCFKYNFSANLSDTSELQLNLHCLNASLNLVLVLFINLKTSPLFGVTKVSLYNMSITCSHMIILHKIIPPRYSILRASCGSSKMSWAGEGGGQALLKIYGA